MTRWARWTESSSGSTFGDDESGWEGHDSAEDLAHAEESEECHLPLAETRAGEDQAGHRLPAEGTEEPGKRWREAANCADRDMMVSASITNFWTFLSTIDTLSGSVFAVQEHAILKRSSEAAQATAFKRGTNWWQGPWMTRGTRGLGR